MKFFNGLIDEIYSLISTADKHVFKITSPWKDVGHNQVIMQRESAFELDGNGFNLVTTDNVDDEIVVVGEDLQNIKGSRKFARISIVKVEDTDSEQQAYKLLRKIEYVKYHYFPDGYMIRTSSRFHKEVVRVSKKALKDGISFQKVGSLLINKTKENPSVKGVKVIFITDSQFDYSLIEKLAVKNNEITETLNHIMNTVNFDCTTCNLKPICDEVEGMRELHFKSSMGGM